MTPERGFAARWLRLFPFPLKIHFKGRQLPAGRGFFKISFALVIRATGFWQPAGQRIFPFTPHTTALRNLPNGAGSFFWLHLPTTGDFRFCQMDTKKAANLFQTYCFHWPRRWRLVFSFENSFHIGMINGELLRYVFKRKRFLLEYIPQNMQSLYLSQCSIYIVFQQ